MIQLFTQALKSALCHGRDDLFSQLAVLRVRPVGQPATGQISRIRIVMSIVAHQQALARSGKDADKDTGPNR